MIVKRLYLNMENWSVSRGSYQLGYISENAVTLLQIATEIDPNCTYHLEQKINDESYILYLEKGDGILTATIPNTMLTSVGNANWQIVGIWSDNSVKKSNIFNVYISNSINAENEVPASEITAFTEALADLAKNMGEVAEYAESASTSAESASTSAESASAAAESASASAESASTSAESASASAESASTYATNASASASEASTHATNASESASEANTSARNARTSASEASTSADEASEYATNASASATTATEQASLASSAATSAQTYAANASTSEQKCAAYASNVYTKAETDEAIRNQVNVLNDKVNSFIKATISGEYHSFDESYNLLTSIPNAYFSSTGSVASQSHNSFTFVTYEEINVYFSAYDIQYTSLCIYPNNTIPSDGYVRYRVQNGVLDSNFPDNINTYVTIPANTLVAITISQQRTAHFELMTNGLYGGFTLNEDIILNQNQVNQVKSAISNYNLSYINGVLSITGNGVTCEFSDLDFNSNHGVFEIQNLTYNNKVIFNTDSDYLGPVRVNGESIKGSKHGEELTDMLKIYADGVEVVNGSNLTARNIDIYVESTISSDEFKRNTIWSFSNNALVVNSTIKALKALQIDYIFGTGIISCQDDVNIAWINNEMLSNSVLTGLNPVTSIVTTGGTLLSKRLSVNSMYGDQRIAFSVYSGRKKLYYYNCYGNNISIPTGAVFSSCCELDFM